MWPKIVFFWTPPPFNRTSLMNGPLDLLIIGTRLLPSFDNNGTLTYVISNEIVIDKDNIKLKAAQDDNSSVKQTKKISHRKFNKI